MIAALAVGGALIAAADLGLAVLCWKRRTVLGGLVAGAGVGLVAVAFASGLHANAAAALVGALIALIVGSVLHGLERGLERLLASQPETTEPATSDVQPAP